MSKFESSTYNSGDNATASSSATSVVGEFAASAWNAGVTRPLVGMAQLQDGNVQMAPERELHGAMKAAHIAGNAAGTLTDIILLSSAVGKGVTALAEGVGATALLGSGMARSLTVAGVTGFTDGFAFTPQQPGETTGTRVAHGFAEGAGFMAVDGTTRFLGSKTLASWKEKLPDLSLTPGAASGAANIGRAWEKTAANWRDKLVDLSLTPGANSGAANIGKAWEVTVPSWASDAGKSAGAFLTKTGEVVGNQFPNLSARSMLRNGYAVFVGGDVAGSVDALLTNKEPNAGSIESNALGWGIANALLGPKIGGRPIEANSGRANATELHTKTAPEAPQDTKTDTVPPKPTYTPETSTLENGDQQWLYRDVPNKGDSTVYTKNEGALLDWEIKTADGQVYNRGTKGPWEINYPDGTTLAKSDLNYLSFTKPIDVELAGKPIKVNEVTQLTPDQEAIGKQWVYEDPAVPGQTVTLNANRTWEAVSADGKAFSNRTKGPWKVTTLDGFVETQGESQEINVERAEGTSNWLDLHGPLPGDPVASSRRPQAFRISAPDMSPMSLSDAPRRMDLKQQEF